MGYQPFRCSLIKTDVSNGPEREEMVLGFLFHILIIKWIGKNRNLQVNNAGSAFPKNIKRTQKKKKDALLRVLLASFPIS